MYNFHFLITLFLVYSFVVNNFIASTKTNFKSNISDFRFKVDHYTVFSPIYYKIFKEKCFISFR